VVALGPLSDCVAFALKLLCEPCPLIVTDE
jgi:hypothetical protein